MKKIAIFTPTLSAGGAEKQACLLAKYLVSAGYDVRVIPFWGLQNANPRNLEILEENDIKILKLPQGMINSLISFIRIVNKEKFDVIFNYLTMCNIVGGIVGRICGIKQVYGGIRNSRLPFVKRCFERIIHNYVSTKTVFNCYSGAEYFESKRFSKSKSEIIHNCYDQISAPINRLRVDSPVIISVGRFVNQKDYFTALDAIKILKDQALNFRYRIVGYGFLESEIREYISTLQLDDIVEVVIAPNNIPELLKNSDIYLSTSLFEGTSNSLLEALDASLPIVSTDVGDNSYIIQNDINGMLHSIGDAPSIAVSLKQLITNYELRTAYGKEGHSILSEEFSGLSFIEHYKKLIDGHI